MSEFTDYMIYQTSARGLEELRAEVAADVVANLRGQVQPVVVHRDEDAFDLEARVEPFPDPGERAEEVG